MAIKILKYTISLVIILASLALGTLIQQFLSISIPGSIIGMLLLFFAMASGLIPAEWVKPTAHVFIRYMIVLFIPISVGLMEHFDLLIENSVQILASTIGASFIMVLFLSYVLERILVGKK
ncbi:UPF0299 membrane protein [Vibrio sp. MACH09]|uniref:CidA/LrgA family protein n=1 Tax=unclassified Vibrio TaxID=2614977 RepID=UPI001493B090|nr:MULTISPECIES: CidA/LrgA family protein [unclassified Vibrio]NOI68539.1 CidA/LrgA family protein [Vibrio sp. 99-8-1]GLO60860.1 UPF0299 membrane protein [Vibrio sp. MACH09]